MRSRGGGGGRTSSTSCEAGEAHIEIWRPAMCSAQAALPAVDIWAKSTILTKTRFLNFFFDHGCMCAVGKQNNVRTIYEGVKSSAAWSTLQAPPCSFQWGIAVGSPRILPRVSQGCPGPFPHCYARPPRPCPRRAAHIIRLMGQLERYGPGSTAS